MRHVVLTWSLLVALMSPLGTARADEDDDDDFELTGYSESYEAPPGEYTSGSFYDNADNLSGRASDGNLFGPAEYGSYFQGDVLWLARSHTVNQTVAVNLPPASQELLNADDASLSNMFQPGLLLTLGRQFDQTSAFELTYFGLNDWTSNAAVTDGGQLSLPGTLPLITQDYIFADRIGIDYSATINNAEANYRQTINGTTLLVGFRYFNLDETFIITSTRDGFGTSTYDVRAVNHLIGGQVGGGYTGQWDRFGLELLGKVGVYGNLADQHSVLLDVNNTFTRRNVEVGSTTTSVIGEVGLNGSYRVTSWLSLRAGYRFLWVNNLALAPNQLDFSSSPSGSEFIDANDYLIFHGVNLGFEARW